MNWWLLLLLAGPTLVVALVTMLVLAILALAARHRAPAFEPEPAAVDAKPMTPSKDREAIEESVPAASVSKSFEFPSRVSRAGFWPQPQPHDECAIGPATALHHAPTVKSMKTSPLFLAVAFGLGLSAMNLSAQDPGGPPPGGPHGGRPHRPPPLVAALDANHDGRIDATEISNSSAALATLDLNKDGQLTADELQPPPPTGAADGQQAPPPPPPPGGPGRPGFKLPLMTALDTDGDGVLSAQEIANAPTALKTLDKNGDGELTPDEFHGMPPGGRPGPGFGGGDPSRRRPPPQ